ncbi:hypothetical protein KSD_17400 [Ktedonobacter sp. SOSP1-85]|uniref:hypothetical protein n=1 Tax=Ktedonobacter sp. SOSP1-85 TaxID=2778367 RepID=UPI00191655B4|nr:hypothetical protein [Ktedonobacter sp. SOSP1-85]GHO73969.1 hypothetical protein KSD_17400 [Ktedonobacter sp. SOSP1-85]
MPRNPEKNVYVTIAFARTSPTLKYLQREAKDMSISVADLIKVLLADRTAALKGQDKQLWLPRKEMTTQSLPSLPHEKTEIVPQTVTTDAPRRAASAASAANYWDD